jgi:hypothetical protein
VNAAVFPDRAAPAPATAPPRARRSRAARIALWIVGAVALYALLVGVALPPLAKKLVADNLGEKLGRTVVLEHLSVNPFTLTARAKNFRILEADGRSAFVSFDRLEADASITSIYRLAPVVDALTLDGLKVNLVRETPERFNFSDILARLAQAGEAARRKRGNAEEEEARFSVSNIRVSGARIDVDDRVKSVKHAVSDMDVTIPFVSNLPAHLKEYVQPAFAAKVNGATLKLQGETLPFEDTLRTHFKIALGAVDIRRYLEYVPVALPFKIDAGVMDADVSLSFTQAGGKQPTIDIAGTAALRDFAASTAEGALARFGRLEVQVASFDPLQGRGKVTAVALRDARAIGEDVAIPSLEARDIAIDLKKKQLRVASVATQDGKLVLRRTRDGSLEMPKLTPARADAAPPEQQAPATPWDVVVAKATISSYQVTLADAAVKPAANHRVVIESLVAEDLSTKDLLSGKANAKVAINKGGLLEVASTFTLEPLLVEASIDARRIDLVPLRPYVKEFQTVAVNSGNASAKGRATLRGKGDALHVAYRGTAEIANLATVDTVGREDLLNWKSVRTCGIDFDMAPKAPLRLAVAEIVVDRIYSRVILNADGKLNLQQLRAATPEEPQPAVPAKEPAPREVRIDRITFVDGRLNFTDHFIRPNYTADVGELQGSVNGLSSAPDTRATVDLKGRYDRTSPVLIAGTVNPLRGDLFLDIAAKGNDIELPRLSAYSVRYAGYGITGGKLNLDVKYHIDGGKMEGRNKILVDQLTFGEKVESPEATKLPVLFAVNLLKDSKGQINLELPVSGSLDDPQFEIAALVSQVLGNLLKKAVTAPFSLLAAALGGGSGGGSGSGASGGDGGDMAYVDFEPGRSDLGAGEQQKLERLVKALQDRPGIKLELAAHADASKDADALRRAELKKRVAAADEAEYARKLKALYVAEKLAPAPPKDSKEAPKEPSVAEMESALLKGIVIGDEQLKALALARGEQAKGYRVASGRLPADRVLVAASAEGEPSSRVAFALR